MFQQHSYPHCICIVFGPSQSGLSTKAILGNHGMVVASRTAAHCGRLSGLWDLLALLPVLLYRPEQENKHSIQTGTFTSVEGAGTGRVRTGAESHTGSAATKPEARFCPNNDESCTVPRGCLASLAPETYSCCTVCNAKSSAKPLKNGRCLGTGFRLSKASHARDTYAMRGSTAVTLAFQRTFTARSCSYTTESVVATQHSSVPRAHTPVDGSP